MRCRSILAVLLGISMTVALPARAEHTRTWRQNDYSEFDRGTAKGVALRSDGKLIPAPKFTPFSDPNLAHLWMLQMDSHGRLYAAGGSDAKVLRFDDPAKPTTVFESSELDAQSIAFDSHDNLYVGTSPDGKVYKVTPDGQKSVFFEPKTKYIWALAVDPQGTVFVATGDKGEVFAVTPGGKGRLFYQSDEQHARSLAFDPKGNLLIGTDPDGLILRVEMIRKNSQEAPEAGASFVLYETNKKEVTSLLAQPDGTLYAAAIGNKQRGPSMQPAIAAVPAPQQQPGANAAAQGGAAVQVQIAQAAQLPFFLSAVTGGAEVVKITPDGSPETLWSSASELVFTMGLSSNGKILLGTGNKGAVIELEGNDIFSSIAKTASEQVTSLVAGPGGKIFVATANPGKIFTLGPDYESNGSFESAAFDAKIFSHWGRLTWWGENGAMQGKVAFYVRSGNTSNPEKNWSPWAGPYKTPDTVRCPPARFVQWKAAFLDTDHGGAPSISWVSLYYQPKNVAPEIDDIVLEDPGIRAQGFGALLNGSGNSASVQLRMPQRTGASANFQVILAASETLSRSNKIETPPQGFADRGYQSVLWSTHDDNDDDLVFAIYYRGEGEKNWRLLKDKLTQNFYSWDAARMPDGAYYLKIVVSDSPSNPPDQALSNERESDRFEIANTPPRVENLRADASVSGARVSFEAASSSNTIDHAQYSVDADDWKIIFPAGLLSDAARESYQVELSDLASGEHTIAVEVADRFGNTTAGKVTFTVPARAPK